MLDEIISGIAAILAITVFVRLRHTLPMLKAPSVSELGSEKLPSVSVCITARNEMSVLAQCLQRVVASDYPKLEIIVLDDASHDDTSIIIKSFAQSGVRFVGNQKLPDGWLGKNYAESILAKEASGRFIVFLDVDTLIGTKTVRRLVEYAYAENARMVSVVPRRTKKLNAQNLLAPLRHLWNVFRFSIDMPQASSNAWLIDRKLINEMFDVDVSLHSTMLMESSIAQNIVKERTYRLLISDEQIDIEYEKAWSGQIDTSIRMLFAECRSQSLQFILYVTCLTVFLVPYFIVWQQPLGFVPILLNFLIAMYYFNHVWPRYRIIGALLVPFVVVQELVLFCISFYRYQRGTILWKDRPVISPMSITGSAHTQQHLK